MLLVLVLAFALSGAEALAADCCAADCREEVSHSEEPRPAGERGSCPVSCPACPCARLVPPVLGQLPVLPESAPPVSFAWWAPPLMHSGSFARGVFLPPRAG